MTRNSGVNKNKTILSNIFILSFVSTILILWLSTSFWLEAYTQRSDATQLEAATKPEETLFNLAASLGSERALMQLILAEENADSEKLDALFDVSVNTKKLMEDAVDEIRQSRLVESRFVTHRYSDQSVEKLIVNLIDGFQRISQTSSIIYLQIASPPAERDEDMRMRIFDAYGHLIQDVNNLRVRIHFLPSRQYQSVVSTHNVKNAAWNLSESVMQIGSLLDGFVVKSDNNSLWNLNRDAMLFRIYQQIQSAEDALYEIGEFSESNDASVELDNQFDALNDAYNNDYRPLEQNLVNALSLQDQMETNLSQWQDQSRNFLSLIHVLIEKTILQTVESADEIKSIANRNLALDTILVLLCIAMATISTRIAKKVQHQATHDDLTGLPNRRFFAQTTERNLRKHAGAVEQELALMTIDLNRFKAVNDTLGHAVGDMLLSQVAQRILSCTDERMFVSRMGGDEFALQFSANDKDETIRLAEEIVQKLEEKFVVEEGFIDIGASIGISFYPQDANNAESLQVTSDFAMFFAKREGKKDGKSSIQLYNRDMAAEFENRLRIERELATAIEENQLELFYQPQVSVAETQVNSVEALLRWNHPTRGSVCPGDFIDVAEECGLMPALGKWVLNEACRQAAEWQHQTEYRIRVAVNVSVHQLMEPDFVQDVFAKLEQYNLSTELLEIEITESVFMADADSVVETLLKLREAGIRLALDDFGTGYSSLSQLQDLPVDTLKIDRSFISKLCAKPGVSHSVTATIATIADVLGMETVAEGVESDFQLSQIADLGINVVQGYFYSKPLPGADILPAIDSVNAAAAGLKKAA